MGGGQLKDENLNQSPSASISTVLVHFVDANGDVVSPQQPLKSLDTPTATDALWARQELITTYSLRYAGKSVLQSIEARAKSTSLATYLSLGGTCLALVLAMAVLAAMWCSQKQRYRRKLKAATTFAFSAPDFTQRPTGTLYDVPGTNLHAK